MRAKHLFWPEDRAPRWSGVRVRASGRRDCLPIASRDRPDYYCVHLVTRGRVWTRNPDGSEQILAAGDMFAHWSGLPYSYVSAEGSKPAAHVLWVILGGPGARDYMGDVGFSADRLNFRARKSGDARRILLRLVEIGETPRPENALEAQRLLADLPLCADWRARTEEPSLARRALTLMEAQLHRGWNINQLAERLGVSRSGLFLRLVAETGESPVRALIRMRTERAGRLLSESGLSIEEIARACGFASVSYFNKQFKRETGKTPGAWRQGAAGG